ncbi:putative fatty acyl-CoA reductase CG5065 [Neocloeon triangulifer]|uniref:putative fatty acyl-CoA reductase CG5065 n=1 Tax=Neocloeon triangulifer TaxID=2078957 RepID=UPI00286EEF27|nr:putative fatty acyl-CoA reductase CG5065 [Neocloeon triangulifer]
MDKPEESLVANFYEGKTVFLTGATGFLGKVLVEKILRSCPGVDSVYCLVRPKRGQDPKTRFEIYIKNLVFDRVRQEQPQNLSKVHLICGDVTEDGLGISQEDRKLLSEKVDVVFHSAATVKFVEPIEVALQMNTFGTRKVVELCREMKNLKAFVHVSTCYSNAVIKDIAEKVYSPPMDPDLLKKLLKEMPTEETKNAKSLIGNHPNTYTFTKAMAEHIVLNETGNIPTAIVRPSIITGSLNEPFPGWVDNLAGITGLTTETMRGTYRSAVCNVACRVDLIPVDLVANCIIVAAAEVHKNKPANGPQVYNCSTGEQNPLKWGRLRDHIIQGAIETPTKYMQFYPSCTYRKSKAVHLFMVFFLHYLPALALDLYLKLAGKRQMAMKIFTNTRNAEKMGEYFATREWNFKSANLMQLVETQSDADRKRFSIDCRQIHWESYVKSYIKGIVMFVLKDDSFTQSVTKNKLQKLYWVQFFCRGVVLVLTLALLL